MLKDSLNKIQQKLKAPKNQYNSFGDYKYRSAEDILEALKPLLKEHNLVLTIKQELVSLGEHVNVATVVELFSTEDKGDSIIATGNAIIDFDVKKLQQPQRTGAASSYSKKYALENLFLLDDTKDPDSTKQETQFIPNAKKVKNSGREMSEEDFNSFIKGIKQGKFSLVEKHLVSYKDSKRKTEVLETLKKVKSGDI